jgi:hypothetical protein
VAERLVRQFPIEVSVNLAPFDHRRDTTTNLRDIERPRLSLLIGCVDNPNARREMARTLEQSSSPNLWWIDLGNSAASGQLHLGNAARVEGVRGSFDAETRTCRALPASSIQAPELLDAPTAPLATPDQDCAEAQATGDQEPFVNRAIAALGLTMVARLCERRLTLRAAFFDLDAGTLRYVHAEPQDIARLVGRRSDGVIRRRRPGAKAQA